MFKKKLIVSLPQTAPVSRLPFTVNGTLILPCMPARCHSWFLFSSSLLCLIIHWFVYIYLCPLHCQGKGHQQLRAHGLGEVGERENEKSTTSCSLFMMKPEGFHPKTNSPLLSPLLNTTRTLMRQNLAVSAISRDKHQNIKLCFPLFCKILGFRIA